MIRFKNKKAQSAFEMCICLPIFMVCVFGAFDLSLMIAGLMDTMIIARDSVRTMSLVSKDNRDKIRKQAADTAAGLVSRLNAPFITFGANNRGISQGNPNQHGVFFADVGAATHNSPQLVQVCSNVKLIVPWMWGIKNGQQMKICSSYYMLRQFKPRKGQ